MRYPTVDGSEIRLTTGMYKTYKTLEIMGAGMSSINSIKPQPLIDLAKWIVGRAQLSSYDS